MKKLYFALAALLLSVSANALEFEDGYYAIGNGTAGNPWLNGVSSYAIDAANRLGFPYDLTYRITYYNVPPSNDYEFLIAEMENDGIAGYYGYDALMSPSGFEKGPNGSAKFSLDATKDITIIFAEFNKKIYAVNFSSELTYLVAGNGSAGSAWCNGENWNYTSTANELSENTITYSNVPAGEYEFLVARRVEESSDHALGYSNLADNTGFTEGSDNKIQFTTTETKNITISLNTNNQVVVTLSTPTAVQEAQADAEVGKVIKTIENGQVILNYPDGSKRNTLGQPLKK